MKTLLTYNEYTNFKKYIKESLEKHRFDDDPGVDFGEHWKKVDKSDPVHKYIEDRLPAYKNIGNEDRTPRVGKVFKVEDRYIAYIEGGENGPGTWKNYSDYLNKLFSNFNNAWVLDLLNNCLSDVWTLRMVFDMKKEGDN